VVGLGVGELVGSLVGDVVGPDVVGEVVGLSVGDVVGSLVGGAVGFDVGAKVGSGVIAFTVDPAQFPCLHVTMIPRPAASRGTSFTFSRRHSAELPYKRGEPT